MTPLDEALRLAQSREDQRRDFYHLFLNSQIFVPIKDTPGLREGAQRLGEEAKFLVQIISQAGKEILRVFDTAERFNAVIKAPTRYMAVPAHALLPGLNPNLHVWLNPGTPFAKEFVPEELAWLREILAGIQTSAREIKAGTKAVVGAPAKIPSGLLEQITLCLKRSREVQAAHLGQIYIVDGGRPPNLVLVLKTDPVSNGVLKAIFEDVGISAQGVLGERPLDMVPYSAEGLAGEIAKATRPFYIR